jgi:hypothetical protein
VREEGENGECNSCGFKVTYNAEEKTASLKSALALTREPGKL